MKNIDYAKIIKDKIKISDVIGKDCDLIRSGNGYKALCPFHKEKTPSFTVSDIKSSYNCFGCGRRGDVYSYVMERNSIDFVDALKLLAPLADVDLNSNKIIYKSDTRNKEKKYFDIMQLISQHYQNNLYYFLQNKNLEILNKKKIDKNLIDKFRLGLSSNSFDLEKHLNKHSIDSSSLIELGIFKENDNGNRFDLFKNRLMFPILDKIDRVLAFGGRLLNGDGPKYINSWENNFFKKRQVLYNLNGLKGLKNRNENIFLVEGYTDVIALSKTGNYAVAPLGTSISLEQLFILWKYIDEPTVFFDGDQAGQKAAKRLLDISLPELDVGKSLNFILLADKVDPDDILNSPNGHEKLFKILKNKKSLLETLMIFEKKIDLSSPERLLGYKKILLNKLNMIRNDEIKRLYKVFLKQNLNDIFTKSLKNNNTGFNQANDAFFLKASKEKSENRFVLRRERAIVVAMINHFKLLQNYDEKLALIPLSNTELSKIRDIIIEILSTNTIFSSEEIKKLLIEKGYSSLLKKHFSTIDCIKYNLVEKHAKETTDIKEASKTLIDLMNIQEKWYKNQNKNLSNNFLKL